MTHSLGILGAGRRVILIYGNDADARADVVKMFEAA